MYVCILSSLRMEEVAFLRAALLAAQQLIDYKYSLQALAVCDDDLHNWLRWWKLETLQDRNEIFRQSKRESMWCNKNRGEENYTALSFSQNKGRRYFENSMIFSTKNRVEMVSLLIKLKFDFEYNIIFLEQKIVFKIS